MNSAYQGIVKEHPLLHPTDVIYKNLIIRESPTLDDEYFSAYSNFTAASQSDATFDVTAPSYDITGADATSGSTTITPGERVLDATTPCALYTNLTAVDAAKQVGRIFVLGANALVHAVGKEETKLHVLDKTDYGLKEGLGQSMIYGSHRVQKFAASGSALATADAIVPQSFQVLCFQGT